MSDRRDRKERDEAIAVARYDLNVYERESKGRDLLAVVQRVLESHGFGEAWSVRWGTTPNGTEGEIMVTLTVENTESPQFILLRRREKGYGWPGQDQEFSWGTYTWVPGT